MFGARHSSKYRQVMGIENMRRWPIYIVFAVCFVLTLSLFNSWNLETELRQRLSDVSLQLRQCSSKEKTCVEDSLALLEQKESLLMKFKSQEEDKLQLRSELTESKQKLTKSQALTNRTQRDVDLCKTELQSLKNLQVSKSGMLETLRLEKTTLTEELEKRKTKIRDLEQEIEKLKTAMASKPAQSPQSSVSVVPAIQDMKLQAAPQKVSKVTPVGEPLKLNPPLVIHNPLNNPLDPELEDNAKEELEDTNAINEGNNPDINDPNDADFDRQAQ